MRLILFLAMLLMATSCMTVPRIQRNCDKFTQVCATSERIVEYRDTVIYRSDTILVKLPSDTVTIVDTIQIVKGVGFLPPVQRDFGLIVANAFVDNSILNVKAWLRDSTILYPVKDTIIIEKAIREENTTTEVKVKYIPDLYRYAFKLIIAEILILLVYLIFKYRSFIGSTLSNTLKLFQKE